MKRYLQNYLDQLAEVKRALQFLSLTRLDIDDSLLSDKERVMLQDCDDAADTLLDIIFDYCE